MTDDPRRSAVSLQLIEAAKANDLEAVRRALDAGAHVDAYEPLEGDANGKLSALYFACNEGWTPIARLLLERGADPDDGESVYHAAQFGHVETLAVLLEHHAEISKAHASWGNTPLTFLCGYFPQQPGAGPAMVGTRWLLEHGADPNQPTNQGETPLHFVGERGQHFELAKLLLAHGADPKVKRNDGRTPWTLAMREGHVAMADLLASAGSPTEASRLDRFLGACARGDEAAARALLAEEPGLVTSMTAEDREVLPRLATGNNLAGVKLLASLGADLASEDRFGGSALHQAAWRGFAPLVKALIALGAPVELRDKTYGSTALGWACHGSRYAHGWGGDYAATVTALIDAGSTREAAFNRWGTPPEEFAIEPIAALLRERGLAPPA